MDLRLKQLLFSPSSVIRPLWLWLGSPSPLSLGCQVRTTWYLYSQVGSKAQVTSSDWRVPSSVDSGVQLILFLNTTPDVREQNGRERNTGERERELLYCFLFYLLILLYFIRVKQVIFPCNYFSEFEQRSQWKETYQVLNCTLEDSHSHIASVRIVSEPTHLASQTTSVLWDYSNLSDIDWLGEGTCFKHLPMIIILLWHDELERLYWKSYGS